MGNVSQIYFNDKDLSKRWSEVREDFWGDFKRETMLTLKQLMETGMELQVQDYIGSRKGEHDELRPTYRNGTRRRKLITGFGYIPDLKVPRIREGRMQFNYLPYYRQRTSDVDKAIVETFLAGVSTRRVKEVIAPLIGPGMVSASSVSTLTKCLNDSVNRYHNRRLSDDYQYLLADGVFFNVKNPIWKRRRCILVLYGIKTNGIRELIDFQPAPQGESEDAWRHFLNRVYHRGLAGKNLRLAARDGNKGLKNALNDVYPMVKQQPCWAHKLRNVSKRLPKRLKDVCIAQARDIYSAKDAKKAMKYFITWARIWNPIVPEAVKCLTDDIDELLNFFNEPISLWKKLRTTNVIERCFREVRRRTRPMSCFQNSDSVQRIIYAVFYRLNKQWENKPLEITHNS